MDDAGKACLGCFVLTMAAMALSLVAGAVVILWGWILL